MGASSIYKSAYSIDKIYPGSSPYDIANLVHHDYAKQYSVETREKFTGYIPSGALEIRWMRSSGPGESYQQTKRIRHQFGKNANSAFESSGLYGPHPALHPGVWDPSNAQGGRSGGGRVT